MAHNLRSLLIAINNLRLLLVRRSGCRGTPAGKPDVSMGLDGCTGRLRSCHGAIIVRCVQLFADCQTVAAIVSRSLMFFHEPSSPPDFNFCPPAGTPLYQVPLLFSPKMPPPAVSYGWLLPQPCSSTSAPTVRLCEKFSFPGCQSVLLCLPLVYKNFLLSLLWISVRLWLFASEVDCWEKLYIRATTYTLGEAAYLPTGLSTCINRGSGNLESYIRRYAHLG